MVYWAETCGRGRRADGTRSVPATLRCSGWGWSLRCVAPASRAGRNEFQCPLLSFNWFGTLKMTEKERSYLSLVIALNIASYVQAAEIAKPKSEIISVWLKRSDAYASAVGDKSRAGVASTLGRLYLEAGDRRRAVAYIGALKDESERIKAQVDLVDSVTAFEGIESAFAYARTLSPTIQQPIGEPPMSPQQGAIFIFFCFKPRMRIFWKRKKRFD